MSTGGTITTPERTLVFVGHPSLRYSRDLLAGEAIPKRSTLATNLPDTTVAPHSWALLGAAYAHALGASVRFVGAVGDDTAGQRLRDFARRYTESDAGIATVNNVTSGLDIHISRAIDHPVFSGETRNVDFRAPEIPPSAFAGLDPAQCHVYVATSDQSALDFAEQVKASGGIVYRRIDDTVLPAFQRVGDATHLSLWILSATRLAGELYGPIPFGMEVPPGELATAVQRGFPDIQSVNVNEPLSDEFAVATDDQTASYKNADRLSEARLATDNAALTAAAFYYLTTGVPPLEAYERAGRFHNIVRSFATDEAALEAPDQLTDQAHDAPSPAVEILATTAGRPPRFVLE